MRITAIDGLPVLDAKHPVTVTVTKDDIKRADVKRPETCAVARACLRETKAYEARVHLGRVYIRQNKGNWLRYQTPQSMRQEIITFDRGGAFEPNTWTLTPPSPAQKANGKRQGSKPKFTHARKNPNRKRRMKYHMTANVRNGPSVAA